MSKTRSCKVNFLQKKRVGSRALAFSKHPQKKIPLQYLSEDDKNASYVLQLECYMLTKLIILKPEIKLTSG